MKTLTRPDGFTNAKLLLALVSLLEVKNHQVATLVLIDAFGDGTAL